MRLEEFTELDAYRLDNDWTFDELSAQMERRADVHIAPRTLHYLLKRAPDDAKPHDRTLYKIRKFLAEARKKAPKRPRRRHAAASTLHP